MDKEYMLKIIIEQLEIYKNIYKCACNNRTPDGKDLTYMGAAVARSLAKKNIGTLRLLQQLLSYCNDSMFIDDAQACTAFDRLVHDGKRK